MNKQTQVVVVLGRKPDSSKLHPEFIDRCDHAVRMLRYTQGYRSIVVVSGGNTVEGRSSEAEEGEIYLRHQMLLVGIDVPILKEEEATTTSENIILTQKLLGEEDVFPDKLVIIGRKSQIPKVRALLWRLWRDKPQTVEFISCLDTAPFWYQCLDVVLMSVASAVDPYDKLNLRKLKKLF